MSAPVTFSTVAAPATGGAAPASLQRAYLELREPPVAGGTGEPGDEVLGVIEFQFNPTELALTKSARWRREAQRNASRSGPPEFTGADPSRLSLEMFFDATDTMDDRVVRAVERLFECCVPTEKSRHGRKGSPPWVVFHWGGLKGFPAYVSSVSARYTVFTPGGIPVRALCAVTLEEISGEQRGHRADTRVAGAGRAHVVVAGDTLPSLAYRAYGDPALWRVIARANGIGDPMRLAVGARLLIPGPEALEDRRDR